MDRAEKEGKVAMAAEVRQELNSSVNAGAKKVKKLGLVAERKQKAASGFIASSVSYAAFDFQPFEGAEFNDEALAMLKKRQPKDNGAASSILRLAPDLLGDLYRDDVIEDLLDEIDAAPQWKCVLETQEIGRITKFEWPDNVWVGVVVAAQDQIDEAERIVSKIEAEVKWIHCRMDTEPLTFRDLDPFDWIVISSANDQVQWHDIEPILNQARKAKCRVFFDPSVKCRPQEFPQIDRAA